MVRLAKTTTVTWQDYPHPDKHAVELSLPGCIHKCPNCHNPDMQFFNMADTIFIDRIEEYLDNLLFRNHTDALVLVGGDPLYSINMQYTNEILALQKYEVCIYTGYELEQVQKEILPYFTFLKTGKYIEFVKQLSYKNDKEIQFASSNQKLYNNSYKLLSSMGKYIF